MTAVSSAAGATPNSYSGAIDLFNRMIDAMQDPKKGIDIAIEMLQKEGAQQHSKLTAKAIGVISKHIKAKNTVAERVNGLRSFIVRDFKEIDIGKIKQAAPAQKRARDVLLELAKAVNVESELKGLVEEIEINGRSVVVCGLTNNKLDERLQELAIKSKINYFDREVIELDVQFGKDVVDKMPAINRGEKNNLHGLMNEQDSWRIQLLGVHSKLITSFFKPQKGAVWFESLKQILGLLLISPQANRKFTRFVNETKSKEITQLLMKCLTQSESEGKEAFSEENLDKLRKKFFDFFKPNDISFIEMIEALLEDSFSDDTTAEVRSALLKLLEYRKAIFNDNLPTNICAEKSVELSKQHRSFHSRLEVEAYLRMFNKIVCGKKFNHDLPTLILIEADNLKAFVSHFKPAEIG